jgi:hypothetical protein
MAKVLKGSQKSKVKSQKSKVESQKSKVKSRKSKVFLPDSIFKLSTLRILGLFQHKLK